MSYWFDGPLERRDIVQIPAIWLAFALSLLIHVLLLWKLLPRNYLLPAETIERSAATGSLQVRLLPSPNPPSAPSHASAGDAQSPTMRVRRLPIAVARTPPRRRIALAKPERKIPATPPIAKSPPTNAPTSGRPPAIGNLASLLDEAGRLARIESSASLRSEPSTPPVEGADARDMRIAEANLGSERTPTFGNDPIRGGGVFQVTSMAYDDARLKFFGWDKDIDRNALQIFTVRIGNNKNMQIAVVRKIIGIIRSQVKGYFVWESKRLGRPVTLSARMEDNAGLEAFLMREFADDASPPQ
jgi:hypothetical protein